MRAGGCGELVGDRADQLQPIAADVDRAVGDAGRRGSRLLSGQHVEPDAHPDQGGHRRDQGDQRDALPAPPRHGVPTSGAVSSTVPVRSAASRSIGIMITSSSDGVK
ncbi:hypothetical protein MIAR_21320 [Microbacterium arabinogalactanolyticum]|nr:hypothetical protein MIAR_21320 [Microbacterium arabinogalactanolyticum]